MRIGDSECVYTSFNIYCIDHICLYNSVDIKYL